MNQTASLRTLDDWLPWLESLSPREIVLGLERVHEVLERLDLGRPPLIINVAGTNGKGSSVAMLEAIHRSAGIRTGCYTSPHLIRYNERIRIDGRAADDEAIIKALRAVETARGDVPLTFFEFGTLAAVKAFDDAGVDAWILEVGMGGRLDAVNAIEPDGCLITNVSLDHCAWLGDDIESIAGEKAGVMRPAKPAVFGATEVPRVIKTHAAATGADLKLRGRDFDVLDSGEAWSWRGAEIELDGLPKPALSGDKQLDNIGAVFALLEALDRTELLDREIVDSALRSVALSGRFQRIEDRWILDVAHNVAAGSALSAQLGGLQFDRLIAVVGMLADKDVDGFLGTFAHRVDEWIAAPVGGSRGQSALDTAIVVANGQCKPCLVSPTLEEALETARYRAADGTMILVTGSFHVVGPALEWLNLN